MKIFGPPGTGKTTELIRLFELELKKTKPNRIGFLTFTRQARLEALGRSGYVEDDLPFLRTIHAICYRQLGVTQGQVVKNKDLKEFAKQTGIQFRGDFDNPWDADYINFGTAPTRDDLLLQLNHLGRHKMIKLKDSLYDAPTEIDFHYAKWFTQTYRQWKDSQSILDYTDLLLRYLEVGRALDIDVLFVDEAQDLSRLQWEVVHRLGGQAERVYIAGDDDQAIFTWAGASATAFIEHPANDVVFLDQSHRVPAAVLRVANDVITRVKNRADKPLKPRSHEGVVGDITYIDDEALKADSNLVLFRNHHRGKLLREQLVELGTPFLGEGSPLSDTAVQRALSGWKDLYDGKSISGLQARAVSSMVDEGYVKDDVSNLVKKDTSKTWSIHDLFVKKIASRNDWLSVMQKLPGKSYLEKTAHFHGFDSLLSPKTKLMSIHQAKGGEAETVILDVEMARKTYDAWFRDPEDEHRVWYVAITRAKDKLLTIIPEGIMYYQI